MDEEDGFRGCLKLMADFASSGIWNEHGMMLDESDVPLSRGLLDRISHWCDWYEQCQDYLPVEERSRHFAYGAHGAEGLAIALLIKAEHPDWNVQYDCTFHDHINGTRAFEIPNLLCAKT